MVAGRSLKLAIFWMYDVVKERGAYKRGSVFNSGFGL